MPRLSYFSASLDRDLLDLRAPVTKRGTRISSLPLPKPAARSTIGTAPLRGQAMVLTTHYGKSGDVHIAYQEFF